VSLLPLAAFLLDAGAYSPSEFLEGILDSVSVGGGRNTSLPLMLEESVGQEVWVS